MFKFPLLQSFQSYVISLSSSRKIAGVAQYENGLGFSPQGEVEVSPILSACPN